MEPAATEDLHRQFDSWVFRVNWAHLSFSFVCFFHSNRYLDIHKIVIYTVVLVVCFAAYPGQKFYGWTRARVCVVSVIGDELKTMVHT